MNLDALLRIRANVVGRESIERLGNSMQGAQGKVKNLAASFAGLRAAIGGVVGLIGAGAIIGKIFGDTATLQSQARSLEVLTGSARQAGQIIQELQAYGAATPFESTDLIETAKRLNAFGVNATQVVEVTKRLGDVAGATGANLDELATAYGQVVAKGRLQGEELLQFQERGVALSAELQKMYKMTGQEFQDALSKGRISAEAVEIAIQRLTDAGGKYANGAIAQSDTLNGRLSTLKDTVTTLAQTLGRVLEPLFKWLLNQAITIVDTIDRAIKSLYGAQNAETIAQVRAGKLPFGPQGVDKIIGEQRRKRLQALAGPGMFGIGYDVDEFIKLLQKEPEFRGRAAAITKPPVIPPLLDPRAAGGGKTSAAAEAKRIASEEKRRREQLTTAQNALRVSQAELRILQELDPVRKIQLEYAEKRRRAEYESTQEIERALSIEQQAYIQRRLAVDLKALDVQETSALNEAYKKLGDKAYEAGLALLNVSNTLANQPVIFQGVTAGLDQYIQQIGTMKEAIADLTTNTFRGLEDVLVSLVTNGTANFREFARSILEATSRMIIQQLILRSIMQAIGFLAPGGDPFSGVGNALSGKGALSTGKMFAGGIFAMGGIMGPDGPMPLKRYASGGVARSPQLALFGEGSMAEAYVPLPDGRRIPVAMQNGGGSNVTVNVDAKGTSVQGDDQRGNQLGRVIAQAVQNELIKQKRPGGLLAAA